MPDVRRFPVHVLQFFKKVETFLGIERIIYQNIDSKEARETMLFYNEHYDLNNTQWPENVAEFMQNMIAEIAIKDAIL